METKEAAYHSFQEVVTKDREPANEGAAPKEDENSETKQSSDSQKLESSWTQETPKSTESSTAPIRSELSREKTPETPSSPTPKQPQKARSPKKKILAVAVVFILLVGGFAGVNFYAQSIIDDTTIDVIKIRVTGSGTDHLDVEIYVMVDNPSSRSGTFQDLDLDVIYKGKTMGTIEVPSREIDSGENEGFIVTTKLVSSSDEAFDSFVSDLLAQDEVEVDVEGDIYIGKGLHTYNTLEKTITIPGLAGLAIDVDRINVTEMDDAGITLAVVVEVFNPSRLDIDVGESSFDLFHNQSWLASFSFQRGLFGGGGTSYHLTNLTIPASREECYNALAADIVAGLSPEFLITGNSTGDLLLSRAM